jgi:hypothetical protein
MKALVSDSAASPNLSPSRTLAVAAAGNRRLVPELAAGIARGERSPSARMCG